MISEGLIKLTLHPAQTWGAIEQRFSTFWDSRTTYKFCLLSLGRRPLLKIVPWKIAKIGLFVCLYPCKMKK